METQIIKKSSCQPYVTDNGEAVETRSAPSRVISYIPYGEIFVEQQSGGWQSPYLFNSKELDSETGLYYYGARYLNPKDTRWLSVDPMFEKYVGMSPYGYCAGNPVRLVDVDGRSIGGTKEDLNLFKEDVSLILSDDSKFAEFKSLLIVNRKKFKKIYPVEKDEAIKGKNLSEDEKNFIECLTNAINSKEKHLVDYFTESKNMSRRSRRAFIRNTAAEGKWELAYQIRDNPKSMEACKKWITDYYYEGITVRNGYNGGSLSTIYRDDDKTKTAIRSMHEVLGHGVAFSHYNNDRRSSTNNSNAVRMENLINRILHLPQWDGSGHAGYPNEITGPYNKPFIK